MAWLEGGALLAAWVPAGSTTPTSFTIAGGPVGASGLASDGERFLAVFHGPGTATADLLGTFIPVPE